MNAMQSLDRDRFEIEAEAYCRRHTPSASPENVRALAGSLRQQAFMEEVQPFLKLKADVYARTIPTITICTDEARVETEYKFSEADQKILDDIDKLIEEVASRYRRAVNPS